MELNVGDSTCNTCDEPLEPGDNIFALWGGEAREGDHGTEFHGTSLEYHHVSCASMRDTRPAEAIWTVYENADGDETVHLFERFLADKGRTWADEVRPVCGRIDNVPEEDVKKERVTRREFHERHDRVCKACSRGFHWEDHR